MMKARYDEAKWKELTMVTPNSSSNQEMLMCTVLLQKVATVWRETLEEEKFDESSTVGEIKLGELLAKRTPCLIS